MAARARNPQERYLFPTDPFPWRDRFFLRRLIEQSIEQVNGPDGEAERCSYFPGDGLSEMVSKEDPPKPGDDGGVQANPVHRSAGEDSIVVVTFSRQKRRKMRTWRLKVTTTERAILRLRPYR